MLHRIKHGRDILCLVNQHKMRAGLLLQRLAFPDERSRVYEVAISYNGRTYAEGKKIGWKDRCSAIRCILKYGMGKTDECRELRPRQESVKGVSPNCHGENKAGA